MEILKALIDFLVGIGKIKGDFTGRIIINLHKGSPSKDIEIAAKEKI